MTSEITPFNFRGHSFYVKRDELLDPLLSGNKYRKLYNLIQTPPSSYEKVISYGGTQSNAMLSLAALCHLKGWEFHYYAKPVASLLKQQPSGNFRQACELGMILHEIEPEHYAAKIEQLRAAAEPANLFIPQGGAAPVAQQGVELLAEEIKAWQDAQNIQHLFIVTPSGTGTTAFYLAAALPQTTVLTTPAAGNSDYLKSQMAKLGVIPDNLTILESEKRYHFAKPYPEFLAIHHELKAAGIEFDLIYGSKMWHVLMQHLQAFTGTILYVHSGGLSGNETMLDRYLHHGLETKD